MKRNPKPFSVEIKKSRVQGQRHQLPPRHLFVLTPAQITPSIQENEPPLVAQPPASPRILPSILEPMRSNSEVVEPARRKSSPRSKSDHGQMEFSLNTIGAENANDANGEDRMVPAAMWQPDTTATPVNKVRAQEVERTTAKTRKPRKKVSETGVSGTVPQLMPQLETVPETKVVEPAPVTGSQRVDRRRITKRQAAAVQLRRNERWKRRLHPAAW